MSEPTIAAVRGRRVWDSRGRPTVEAEVQLADGSTGRAIAPAGASRGRFEAAELRDGGTAAGGWGVAHAVAHVNGEIADALRGLDGADQAAIDEALEALDGTENLARLGGNATIATSMAALHAAAVSRGEPLWRHVAAGGPVSLPLAQVQILGGGAHASRRVDVQDFMVQALSAATFDESMAMIADVYRAAGVVLAERGLLQGVADEGGYWPAFDDNESAIDSVVAAVERAGYEPGTDVGIALDIAASELATSDRSGPAGYRLALEDRVLDAGQMVDLVESWLDRFPITSIEDPLAETDAGGWELLRDRIGDRVQIVGDDLLVTNAAKVRDAAARGVANALLVKPNQAGTITRTKAAFDAARAAGWATIASARSGESEDVTIVHLAVGWNAGQLKVGSFARSERMAKWNEGIRIEEHLGAAGAYAGAAALAGRPRPRPPLRPTDTKATNP